MIPYCSICWDDNKVRLLDQRLLPQQEIYLETTDYHDVIEAIRTLAIRGAPAIGVAAAMGVALGVMKSQAATIAELRAAGTPSREAVAQLMLRCGLARRVAYAAWHRGV